VLLVAALIGFLVAVATPVFLRSLHGQRLRQATRTLQQAGRYARTMAILKGQGMSLVLNPSNNEIALREAPPPRPAPLEAIYTRDQVLAIAEPTLSVSSPPPADRDLLSPPSDTSEPLRSPRTLTRLLEGVRIRSVRLGDADVSDMETAIEIAYLPNGTCRPYTVVLENEVGRQAVLTVDTVGEALCDFP
jgi:type II secretory pathway pseudopilin PulG